MRTLSTQPTAAAAAAAAAALEAAAFDGCSTSSSGASASTSGVGSAVLSVRRRRRAAVAAVALAVLLAAALLPTARAVCTLPGIANGLLYISGGYDWGGNDNYQSTASTDTSSAESCYNFCNGKSGVIGLALSVGANCWCKTALNTITGSNTRQTGPVGVGNTLNNIPTGAQAFVDCIAGYDWIGTGQRGCQSSGAFDGVQPICTRPCSLAYSNTPTGGLVYASGYDWSGYDVASYSNYAGPFREQDCMTKCNTVSGAAVWSVVGTTCYCKSSSALTMQPVSHSLPCSAGPTAGNTISYLIEGTTVNYGCARGFLPAFSVTSTCTANSFSTSAFYCAATCNLGYTNTSSTGFQYVKNYDWVGNDITSATGYGTPGLCIAYCKTAASSAKMWLVDPSGKCWCKSDFNPYPTASTGAYAGPTSGNTLSFVPTGALVVNDCWNGYYSSGSQTCSEGGYQGSVSCLPNPCTLSFQYAASTGLWYISGYDFGGTDLSPSSADQSSALTCYQYCVTQFGATGFSYWKWDARSATKPCYCKSSAVTTGGTATTNIYYGVRSGTTLTKIANGAQRVQTCDSGYAASGGSSQSCSLSAWTGSALTCADVNECATSNGGCDSKTNCTNTVGSRTCSACPSGYTSTSGTGSTPCITQCASNPCSAAGSVNCTTLTSSYFCLCKAGYQGAQCQTNINECASNPCRNGATCVDGINSFTCTCAAGFSGTLCQTDINECASAPCLRGGTCLDGTNGFTCACISGYSGSVCQTDINECASSPCRNGGTCTDKVAAFNCTCAAGYSGTTCQTNINECSSNPCRSGGSCVDGVNSFTCTCASGYSGATCQTDINECASAPCKNGATCVDAVAAYSCTCAAGYSGFWCQTDINECASNPCRFGGTCSDAVNGFTCACTAGRSGSVCQTDVNECASLPCRNGGTCTDAVNGYSCTCAQGYSGTFCQTDVNECASAPCRNGATCVDGVNGFTCTCVAGYSGTLCQTDINECASNPCVYGSCADLVNAFNCTCIHGIIGTRCNVDVNECATNNGGCNANAVCTNTLASYYCSAYLIPGTLYSPDYASYATPSANVLTTTTAAGIRVAFNISVYSVPYANNSLDLTIALGTAANPILFPCSGLTFVAGSLLNYAAQCTLPAAAGLNLQLYATQASTAGAVVWSASNQTVSFPAPTITAVTLRRNQTGYSSARTSDLVLDTNDVVRVQFDGTNLYGPLTNVTYGTENGGYHNYTCAVVNALSTPNTITCETYAGSAGINHVFAIDVFGQKAQGSDRLSFPVVPEVDSVSGCTQSASCAGGGSSGTCECPTEGGVTLTIRGSNFVQSGIAVTVNGLACSSPVVKDDGSGTELTCTLPASAGDSRPVVVYATGYPSIPVNYVTYALPTFTGLTFGSVAATGCTQTTATRVSGCGNTGGTLLTVMGMNFGPPTAVVLLGAHLCENPTHDAVTPHRKLTCTAPAGTGTGHKLLMLQSGGSFGVGTAPLFDYYQCPYGLYRSGYSCLPCPDGQYSNKLDTQSCTPCDGGFVSGAAPSTGCTACGVGSVSVGGVSSCSNCTAGTYMPFIGKIVCTPCGTGKFSTQNSSTTCEQCPPRTQQPQVGQSGCQDCPLGTASNAYAVATCSPCNAGYFANATGMAQCLACPAGSYQPLPGQTGCLPVAAGYYADRSGASAQTPCAAGTYSARANATTCDDCGAGSYQSSQGQSACVVCSAGYYSVAPVRPLNLNTACTQCVKGRWTAANTTACTDCLPGSYQPLPGSDHCEPTSPGTYTDAAAQSTVKTCDAGRYSDVQNATFCWMCGAGFYQSVAGSTTCAPCAGGQYTPTPTLFALNTLPSTCTAGTYSVGTSVLGNSTTCTACDAGWYAPAGSSQCYECGVGTFSTARSGSCSECPRGTFSDSNGTANACSFCPKGTKGADVMSTDCQTCTAGSYSPVPNAGAVNKECTLCDAGTYSGDEADTCLQCPKGKYSSLGSVNCTDCDVGKFAASMGSKECTDCAAGQYQPLTGQSFCSLCRNGTYQPGTIATACFDCTVGKYAPEPGTGGAGYNTACTDAAQGQYVNTNRSASYSQCQKGEYQDAVQQTACSKCGVGTYSDTVGFRNFPCTSCPAGKFNAAQGQSACTDCPPGRSQSRSGSTSCDICGAGSAASGYGNRLCSDCASGTYTNTSEQESCVKCRAPYVSGVDSGATSCSKSCTGTLYQTADGQSGCSQCATQSYWSGSQCESCPTGSNCAPIAVGGITGTNGYYVYRTEDGQVKSLTCASCVACASTSTSTSNATTESADGSAGSAVFSCCGANYAPAASNPMCGSCAEGFHNSGDSCIECDSTNWSYVALILLASWAYITMFHIISQASSADSRIFLNYVQFVYLFMAAQAGSLTSWLSVFNFNLFVASGSNCVSPMTDLERLSTGLFVPLVGLAFLLVNVVLHYALYRCGWRNQMCCLPAVLNIKPQTSFHFIFRSYRRTALGFVASSYPSFCQTVFTFFSCVQYGDDKFILTYPAVSCLHDPQYQRVYWFFVLLMAAVVATPVLLYWRLYSLYKTGHLDPDHPSDEVVVYGIVCETYKPQLYGWEAFVLIRRMIVAAVLLAPEFNTDTASKFTWLCLTQVVFLSVHFYKKPFKLDLDNQMEALGELTLIVLALFLVSAPSPLTPLYAGVLTAMCLAIGGVFLMRTLLLRIDQSMVVLRRVVIPLQESCPACTRYCGFWCCCVTETELYEAKEQRKREALARAAASSFGEAPMPVGGLMSMQTLRGGAGGGFAAMPMHALPPAAAGDHAADAHDVSRAHGAHGHDAADAKGHGHSRVGSLASTADVELHKKHSNSDDRKAAALSRQPSDGSTATAPGAGGSPAFGSHPSPSSAGGSAKAAEGKRPGSASTRLQQRAAKAAAGAAALELPREHTPGAIMSPSTNSTPTPEAVEGKMAAAAAAAEAASVAAAAAAAPAPPLDTGAEAEDEPNAASAEVELPVIAGLKLSHAAAHAVAAASRENAGVWGSAGGMSAREQHEHAAVIDAQVSATLASANALVRTLTQNRGAVLGSSKPALKSGRKEAVEQLSARNSAANSARGSARNSARNSARTTPRGGHSQGATPKHVSTAAAVVASAGAGAADAAGAGAAAAAAAAPAGFSAGATDATAHATTSTDAAITVLPTPGVAAPPAPAWGNP